MRVKNLITLMIVLLASAIPSLAASYYVTVLKHATAVSEWKYDHAYQLTLGEGQTDLYSSLRSENFGKGSDEVYFIISTGPQSSKFSISNGNGKQMLTDFGAEGDVVFSSKIYKSTSLPKKADIFFTPTYNADSVVTGGHLKALGSKELVFYNSGSKEYSPGTYRWVPTADGSTYEITDFRIPANQPFTIFTGGGAGALNKNTTVEELLPNTEYDECTSNKLYKFENQFYGTLRIENGKIIFIPTEVKPLDRDAEIYLLVFKTATVTDDEGVSTTVYTIFNEDGSIDENCVYTLQMGGGVDENGDVTDRENAVIGTIWSTLRNLEINSNQIFMVTQTLPETYLHPDIAATATPLAFNGQTMTNDEQAVSFDTAFRLSTTSIYGSFVYDTADAADPIIRFFPTLYLRGYGEHGIGNNSDGKLSTKGAAVEFTTIDGKNYYLNDDVTLKKNWVYSIYCDDVTIYDQGKMKSEQWIDSLWVTNKNGLTPPSGIQSVKIREVLYHATDAGLVWYHSAFQFHTESANTNIHVVVNDLDKEHEIEFTTSTDATYYLVEVAKDGSAYHHVKGIYPFNRCRRIDMHDHQGNELGKELVYIRTIPNKPVADDDITNPRIDKQGFVAGTRFFVTASDPSSLQGKNIDLRAPTTIKKKNWDSWQQIKMGKYAIYDTDQHFYGTIVLDPDGKNIKINFQQENPVEFDYTQYLNEDHKLLDKTIFTGETLDTKTFIPSPDLEKKELWHQDKSLKDQTESPTTITFRNVLPDGKTVTGDKTMKYKTTYFAGRRAMTGPGYIVNTLAPGGLANVAEANVKLDNIIADDLTANGSLGTLVNVDLTSAPLITVRDTKRYYARGTVAGFNVVANSEVSVLSLDVIKMWTLGFYRDGVLVATRPIDAANGTAVNLSLITIGPKESSLDLECTAPCVFDEVGIVITGGLNLEVAQMLKVNYAYVGEPNVIELTTAGVQQYNDEHPDQNGLYIEDMKLNGTDAGVDKLKDKDQYSNFIMVLQLGNGSVEAHMENSALPADEEVFKKGSRVNFHLSGGSLLDLAIGSTNSITLYDRNNNELGKHYLASTVLNLGVVSISGDQVISMVAPCDFSGLRLDVNGLAVDLGETLISHLSVHEPPFQEHHCDFKLPESVFLNSKTIVTQYFYEDPDTKQKTYEYSKTEIETPRAYPMPWQPIQGVELEWDLVSKPEGSEAKINNDYVPLSKAATAAISDEEAASSAYGLIYDIDKDGLYELSYRAYSWDNGEKVYHPECTGTVKVWLNKPAEAVGGMTIVGCGTQLADTAILDPINNTQIAPACELSWNAHSSSGGIAIGQQKVTNSANILKPGLDNYATAAINISLIENRHLVGIKTISGENFGKTVTGLDGNQRNADVRVGFIIENNIDVLSLSALNFLNIRAYDKNGNEVFQKVVEDQNAVGLQLGGSVNKEKDFKRYSIVVPGYTQDNTALQFSEFALWSSGVANANLSELKIYGAFVEVIDPQDPCGAITQCADSKVVSEATVVPMSAGVAKIGSTIKNMSFLVDDDENYQTYMSVTNGVDAGEGYIIQVKLGRTIPAYQQVALIVDKDTYLAGVQVGNWLTVTCHNDLANAAPITSTDPYVPANDPVYETEPLKWDDKKYDSGTIPSGEKDPNYTGDKFSEWGLVGADVAGGGDKYALYFTPKNDFNELQMTMASIVNAVNVDQKYYGICTQGDADGDGVPDCMSNDLREVRSVTYAIRTGIENIVGEQEAVANVSVAVMGDGTAYVTAQGMGIDRVLVYDMAGYAYDAADGQGQNTATVQLHQGVSIVETFLMDGSAVSTKVMR